MRALLLASLFSLAFGGVAWADEFDTKISYSREAKDGKKAFSQDGVAARIRPNRDGVMYCHIETGPFKLYGRPMPGDKIVAADESEWRVVKDGAPGASDIYHLHIELTKAAPKKP